MQRFSKLRNDKEEKLGSTGAASASRVRSTRNLDETLNRHHGIQLESIVYSVLLVAAPPTFFEGGLPA